MPSDPRTLDQCGICSLLGERAADEMFGCVIPGAVDMDHISDQMLVESIVRDKAKCENCPHRGDRE